MINDVVVIDLDEALFNSQHRAHLALAGEWSIYEEMMRYDTPHDEVKSLINILSINNYMLIGMTSMKEKNRLMVCDWLINYKVPFDTIIMRPNDDFGRFTEMKKQLLDNFCKEIIGQSSEESISFILSSGEKAVETWRDYGFLCWQCRP